VIYNATTTNQLDTQRTVFIYCVAREIVPSMSALPATAPALQG